MKYVTTQSIVRTEPITIDSLVAVKAAIEALGEMPNVFRCHPAVYNQMRIYFDRKEAEEMMQGIYRPPRDLKHLGDIYGIDILIDKDLKPYEWRFERVLIDS